MQVVVEATKQVLEMASPTESVVNGHAESIDAAEASVSQISSNGSSRHEEENPVSDITSLTEIETPIQLEQVDNTILRVSLFLQLVLFHPESGMLIA